MLELHNLTLSYGDKPVLRDCSLRLAKGERAALMGPSGCGKTTLLRIALGIQQADAGRRSCEAQRIAAVFQEPRLLPWRTAAENVNLVLSDSPATLSAAQDWLERFELAEAAALYPAELSGGMQQRVSLARALATKPELLILDEPLKAMDEALSLRIRERLSEALTGCTLLLATHSEEEAKALGCTVLRYTDGRFL